VIAILAPVPAEILSGGIQVKNPEGRVAFGTGTMTGENSGAWSFEFFSKPEIQDRKGEIRVLIYGSSTDGSGSPLYHPGHVIAVAVYERIQEAKACKHPRSDFRPKSALSGDSDYPLFWEVSKLRGLPAAEHLPLKKLKLFGTGKLKSYPGTPPRGPQLIVVPEELAASLY
jgi:hypothetical protein